MRRWFSSGFRGWAGLALGLVGSLACVEALAWWWMNPPGGDAERVLGYRPGQVAAGNEGEAADAGGFALTQRTPLPGLVEKSLPVLRCSAGRVFHGVTRNGLSLHLAWFEWQDADTGSVMEAFRHVPEDCLGAIGMTFVSREPARAYVLEGETLWFDHTTFRDPVQSLLPGGVAQGGLVHAFRAVWVAGRGADKPSTGVLGATADDLRSLRLQSALRRYRPGHARVIQAAVRGTADGEVAWRAFEQSLLRDLAWEGLDGPSRQGGG